jgi:hypothetical protein
MRRSELLARLGSNSPCLFCHLPAEALTQAGKGDAAFLLPSLAQAIWQTTALDESDRARLNEVLSGLLQCSRDVDSEFSELAAEARLASLTLALPDEHLRELCTDFFTLLGL